MTHSLRGTRTPTPAQAAGALGVIALLGVLGWALNRDPDPQGAETAAEPVVAVSEPSPAERRRMQDSIAVLALADSSQNSLSFHALSDLEHRLHSQRFDVPHARAHARYVRAVMDSAAVWLDRREPNVAFGFLARTQPPMTPADSARYKRLHSRASAQVDARVAAQQRAAGPAPAPAPPQAPSGRRWYEGGTLHRATMAEWRNAGGENRLATAADFASAILKPRTAEQVRGPAREMATCITTAREMPGYKEVSETAALCAVLMGW